MRQRRERDDDDDDDDDRARLRTLSIDVDHDVDRDAGFNDGATMSTTPASMRAAMATRMCAQPVV